MHLFAFRRQKTTALDAFVVLTLSFLASESS